MVPSKNGFALKPTTEELKKNKIVKTKITISFLKGRMYVNHTTLVTFYYVE
jgi:hypothetical protein